MSSNQESNFASEFFSGYGSLEDIQQPQPTSIPSDGSNNIPPLFQPISKLAQFYRPTPKVDVGNTPKSTAPSSSISSDGSNNIPSSDSTNPNPKMDVEHPPNSTAPSNVSLADSTKSDSSSSSNSSTSPKDQSTQSDSSSNSDSDEVDLIDYKSALSIVQNQPICILYIQKPNQKRKTCLFLAITKDNPHALTGVFKSQSGLPDIGSWIRVPGCYWKSDVLCVPKIELMPHHEKIQAVLKDLVSFISNAFGKWEKSDWLIKHGLGGVKSSSLKEFLRTEKEIVNRSNQSKRPRSESDSSSNLGSQPTKSDPSSNEQSNVGPSLKKAKTNSMPTDQVRKSPRLNQPQPNKQTPPVKRTPKPSKESPKCKEITRRGSPCKLTPVLNEDYCWKHLRNHKQQPQPDVKIDDSAQTESDGSSKMLQDGTPIQAIPVALPQDHLVSQSPIQHQSLAQADTPFSQQQIQLIQAMIQNQSRPQVPEHQLVPFNQSQPQVLDHQQPLPTQNQSQPQVLDHQLVPFSQPQPQGLDNQMALFSPQAQRIQHQSQPQVLDHQQPQPFSQFQVPTQRQQLAPPQDQLPRTDSLSSRLEMIDNKLSQLLAQPQATFAQSNSPGYHLNSTAPIEINRPLIFVFGGSQTLPQRFPQMAGQNLLGLIEEQQGDHRYNYGRRPNITCPNCSFSNPPENDFCGRCANRFGRW